MANKMIEKYNAITGKTLADAIDKHPNDWQAEIANNRMFNVSGEKPVAYQGVNAINLAITNTNRDNTDNRFMTRIQAEKAGFSIKDDAKATAISYLQIQNREVKGKRVKIPMMRIAYVYNAKDIDGIAKAPKDISALSKISDLPAEQLIAKSGIKVVKSKSQLLSKYNADKNQIEIASKIFDKKGDAFVSAYAAVASKVAVEQNYTNDSKDVQSFKAQMSAALITQKAGAKFVLRGNLASRSTFKTDFLKDQLVGMKAIRSSAKIANFVIEGKSFEMTKDKVNANDKVDVGKDKAKPTKAKSKTAPTKAKAKGKNAQALAKRRAKTNEREGLLTGVM